MLSLRSYKPFICCSNIKLEGKNCSCFESLFGLYFIGYHKEQLCVSLSMLLPVLKVLLELIVLHTARHRNYRCPQDTAQFYVGTLSNVVMHALVQSLFCLALVTRFKILHFSSVVSSQQAPLHVIDLIKLAPTGSLQLANCATEIQTKLQPMTYMNKCQCAGIKHHRLLFCWLVSWRESRQQSHCGKVPKVSVRITCISGYQTNDYASSLNLHHSAM